MGYRFIVILRTKQELQDIVDSNPFKDYNGDVKYYFTFLAEESKKTPIMPIIMKKKENEVIKYENNNVYTVGFNVKGKYGFPNVFIEKEFVVKATSRNLNTILKILK